MALWTKAIRAEPPVTLLRKRNRSAKKNRPAIRKTVAVNQLINQQISSLCLWPGQVLVDLSTRWNPTNQINAGPSKESHVVDLTNGF